MVKRNYEGRLKKLTAYSGVQFRLLELYDTSIDMYSMLKEMSEPILKANRKRRERNLKSLEEICKKRDEEIFALQKQRLDLADSEEVKELICILNKMREEYKELSDP